VEIMRRILWASFLVPTLLAGCQSTIGRAPGPETPDLADEAIGTLIVPPVGPGALHRTVRLIDLPSLRELEVPLEHDPVAFAGVDERGQLLYVFDVNAGVTLGDYARYIFESEPQRAAHFERWRLRGVDVGSRTERDLGSLEGFPCVLELSPNGGRLIAVHAGLRSRVEPSEPPSDVWCIDLTSGDRRVVFHQLGQVLRCDWKPDGSAFALTGTAGGELFDAASLASLELRLHGFGPFTPDGRAFLRRNGDGHELVELDGEAVLVGDPLLPWPATRGPAHERGEVEPIGLCGARLALYEALPTQGNQVESSFARGGYLRYEHEAVKVADLETGSYATVLAGNESPWTPLYSHVRLNTVP
jgi:hypothetical protein